MEKKMLWWSVRLNAATNEFVSIITKHKDQNKNSTKQNETKRRNASEHIMSIEFHLITSLQKQQHHRNSIETLLVRIEFSFKPRKMRERTHTYIVAWTKHISEKQWIWRRKKNSLYKMALVKHTLTVVC